LDDPDVNYIDAVLGFFRNSFLTAERAARAQDRIFQGRENGRRGGDPYREQARSGRRSSLGCFARLSADGARTPLPRMAAALSYYTVFSMAPL
jgi:hypothetical protein